MGAGVVVGSRHPRDGLDRATSWLVSQFDPTTEVIPSAFAPGSDDLGGTINAVLSLAMSGGGSDTARAALTALESRVDELVIDTDGNDVPAALARLIVGAVAFGRDPADFGGHDLVSRLAATVAATGPDAGRVGVQDATYDGAFRQGLALAALSLVSPTPAVIDPGAGPIGDVPAVKWLVDQQCADGSWMPYRSDLGEACAYDPATFSGPDSNSTALAVIGLSAVGATANVDAMAWLTGIRNADGGWSFDGASGSPSDPDSTGLVMGALRAAGQEPDSAAYATLLGFQFGSDAPAADQGAFWYPPFTGPPVASLLATNDAVLGLADGAFPEVAVANADSATTTSTTAPSTTTVTTTTVASTTVPSTTETPTTAPPTTQAASATTDPAAALGAATNVPPASSTPQTNSGSLAFTGTEVGAEVAAGSVLIALGLALAAIGRRRRRS